MKIEGYHWTKEKTRLFLDHFNAFIRQHHEGHSSSGSAKAISTNEYQTSISDHLDINGEQINYFWKITQNLDGELVKIESNPQEVISKNSEFQSRVENIYNEVLESAFSERKSNFFKRNYYCYIGSNLDGEYWIKKVRIAPCLPVDGIDTIINAERYICVDFEIDAIDEHNAAILSEDLSSRLLYRLSLISNIGFYKPSTDQVWVLTGNSERPSERFQRAFYDPNRMDRMPRKRELCHLGAYAGSIDNIYATTSKMTLPKETRPIFSGLEKSNIQLVNAFDSAAQIYNLSHVAGRRFATVRLAYLVSCIDAIRSRSKSGQSFTQFLQEYSGENTVDESLTEILYGKIRSAHFHGGDFPLDMSVFYHLDLTNLNAARASGISFQGYAIIRTAIVNWMKKKIMENK